MIDQIILYGYFLAVFGSLYKIFEKAGEESWKGFVPGLNFYVWLKILKRPWWWLFLLIVPGVNFLMFIILNVQLAWAFGKISRQDTLLAIFLPFYVLPNLAYKEAETYKGPHKWRDPKARNWRKDWADAILFAVIAATIIRTLTLEAFTIPTGSMEKSLLKGDFLFVSKVSYGSRMPMTPISFPFVHHTLPFTASTPSFLEWWTLPYFRLPGFGDVERNDVVVFNFPEGDTVVADIQNQSYYQILRDATLQMGGSYTDIVTQSGIYLAARNAIWQNQDILVRPIDKQENYIKRCVGLPGDSLQIIDGQLYVNGEVADNPEHMQFVYYVFANSSIMQGLTQGVDAQGNYRWLGQSDWLKDDYDIYYEEQYILDVNKEAGKVKLRLALTETDVQTMSQVPGIDSIVSTIEPDTGVAHPSLAIFPNHPKITWTKDNFGPICVPAEGTTVELTGMNLQLYRRIIEVYENNTLEIRDGKIFINDQETSTYTFQQNYYWLMGDNRHNSQDSRYWGFVPHDHVVGKGSFIFFSKDPEAGMFSGGIRWGRMFNLVD